MEEPKYSNKLLGLGIKCHWCGGAPWSYPADGLGRCWAHKDEETPPDHVEQLDLATQFCADHLQREADRIGRVARDRGWEKDWANGGVYIHLEVSEFIESLRGKGNIIEEAADVLVSYFAVLENYNIPLKDVIKQLNVTLTDLEDGKRGVFGNK